MAAKTSLAWQGFRHSNIVSTSASTAARNGDLEDSDGAEEDGFVGADSSGSQEIMMEIMDKYVQAGEVLAEKENDVRQLTKQVDELKVANSDLETRAMQLKKMNEKLADDEGRWYSLARELENQMDVIKKGETYTLFQDKVDEAEARLEVATETANVFKRRLHQVYGVVSQDFEDKSNDGGEQDVDEHRQHATILAQLQHLINSTTELEATLVVSREARAEAELASQQAHAQEEKHEVELSTLRKEVATCRSRADELQKALDDSMRSCMAAEAAAKDMDEARRQAAEHQRRAEESRGASLADLAVAREQSQLMQQSLADARSEAHARQEQSRSLRQARDTAEGSAEQSLKRVLELEGLLQVAQSRVCQAESDSLQRIEELTRASEVHKEEVAAAVARTEGVEAKAAAQESTLRKAEERVAELEDALQVIQVQLEEKETAARRKLSGAEEQVKELRQALEKATVGASAAEEYASRVEVLQKDLETAGKMASAAEEVAAQQAQELQKELEVAKVAAATAREDAEKVAEQALSAAEAHALQVEGLQRDLEEAHDAASSASLQHTAQVNDLRGELDHAVAEASATQELTAEVQELREELESANAAASAAEEYAAEVADLREELERSKEATLAAQEDVVSSNEARVAAEAAVQSSEGAKAEVEARVEALRQSLAAKEVQAEKSAHRAQDVDAITAALLESKVQVEERLSTSEQAREEAAGQVALLLENLRGLKAQVDDACASRDRLQELRDQQQEALDSSDARAKDLERRLSSMQAELDERTAEVERATEEADLARAGAGNGTGNGTLGPDSRSESASVDIATPDAPCANSLFGSPAPDHGASNGAGARAVVPNGSAGDRGAAVPVTSVVASVAGTAEAEQLQAHAEAMELELRYTLESFEGQLSAMAREKVAIQKQVKELTGQCSTLRKQVSHYKKVAKESEAQVEQMLELQQQLCEAEAAAERLRATNSELTAKVEVLEADKVNATMWRKSQEEVLELRARLLETDNIIAARSQEMTAKAKQVASAKARAGELEKRVREAEDELLAVKEASASMAEELSSSLSKTNALRSVAERVSELEADATASEGDRQHLESEVAASRAALTEAEEVVRSVREEKQEMMDALRKADEAQATVTAQLEDMASALGCESSKESTYMSSSRCDGIADKIRGLKARLANAEDLLEGTAEALARTAVEGEVELESGCSWVINGVTSLQRRLEISELKLAQSTEAQDKAGYAVNMLEELSAVLECDGHTVTHKVHELKKLAHELFQQRDVHVKEIEQLKEDAIAQTSSNAEMISQMFPADEVAAAREDVAVLQVTVDSLKHELLEAQQLRARDSEKHRREEARLQDRHDALTRFIEGGANVGGGPHAAGHAAGMTMHRKSSSFHMDASSASGWLAEQGHGEYSSGTSAVNGDGKVSKLWDSSLAGPGRRRSLSLAGESQRNGFPRGSEVAPAVKIEREPEGSKDAAVLSKIQAILGCKKDQLVAAMEEQQATLEEQHVTARILVDVKHSYFSNMDSLACAMGEEALATVSPMLAQASELCTKRACLMSSQEGLELLDEVTSVLAGLLMKANAAHAHTPEVALQQAQESIAALNETLRKERLMMMAFRRWGHFYLALSNQALRKRTRERNQARGQRHTPENASLVMSAQRPDTRGRSRRRVSAGHVGEQGEERQLQPSSEDIQAMVEKELETVARELADEPSSSLVALADARKEMDKMAMKAQATLGVLYTQPSRITGVTEPTMNTATLSGMVDRSDELRLETLDTAVPSSGLYSEVKVDQSCDGVVALHVASSEGLMVGPPMAPSILGKEQEHQEQRQEQEQQAEAKDEILVTEQVTGVSQAAEDIAATDGSCQQGDLSSFPGTELALSEQEQEHRLTGSDVQDERRVPHEEDNSNAKAAHGAGVTPSRDGDAVSLQPPKSLSASPPPTMGLSNGAAGSNGTSQTCSNGAAARSQNASKGRATGPLVEDCISKAERAEFLRKQREERKAHRKRGIKASGARAGGGEAVMKASLRNRRTSAPAFIPSTASAPPAVATPLTTALPPLSGAKEPEPEPEPGRSPEAHLSQGNGPSADEQGAPPGMQLVDEPREKGSRAASSSAAEARSAVNSELVATATPAALAPPPRMFNPTALPPPLAPPSAVVSGQAQPPRHPSMAFSVNATVEKALTQAKQDATLAERRATFWKHRFRDLAVWAASFALLSYASDHGFEDC